MVETPAHTVPRERPRVLFLTTHASYFASHRLGLARALRDQGIEVIAAAARDASVAAIEREGVIFRNMPFERYGVNPLRELATVTEITRLYSDSKPLLAHHFGHKPVVYGAIAARLSGVAAIGTLPGLGFAFTAGGARACAARVALKILYRVLRTVNPRLVFQNCADQQLFLDKGLASHTQTTLIPGSGVDCRKFRPHPESEGTPVVVLAARMLRYKGVMEFVSAARLIAERGIPAQFVLAGAPGDGQPAGIAETQLRAWHEEGTVTWVGHSLDVPGLFARAHIVCLPSYGEGLPLSLAEAAASGRPIVATNIPGCRAVVRDLVNGFLVPVRDSVTLANRIAELLADPVLRQRMGAAGRDFAVRELSIERCVEKTFAVYRELGLAVHAPGETLQPSH